MSSKPLLLGEDTTPRKTTPTCNHQSSTNNKHQLHQHTEALEALARPYTPLQEPAPEGEEFEGELFFDAEELQVLELPEGATPALVNTLAADAADLYEAVHASIVGEKVEKVELKAEEVEDMLPPLSTGAPPSPVPRTGSRARVGQGWLLVFGGWGWRFLCVGMVFFVWVWHRAQTWTACIDLHVDHNPPTLYVYYYKVSLHDHYKPQTNTPVCVLLQNTIPAIHHRQRPSSKKH